MLANRLTKLWSRRAPLPQDVEEAIARLQQLGERQPELQALAATNAALLKAMYAHDLPLPHLDLGPAHAQAKREGGVPLLRGEPIVFEAAALRDQFVRLCGVMDDQGNQFAAALGRAAKAGVFPVAELAVEVIVGDPQKVVTRAADLDLDAGLAATLLRLTLFPILERLTSQVKPLIDSATWRRSYCPVCGSWPMLGEYRGLELTRFLRCGLCTAEWEIERLVCVFCDNRMHQDLINLTVAGEGTKERAVACERCHCYIKQISTLAPIPPAQLLVADLATLHLDLAALERTYAPPH